MRIGCSAWSFRREMPARMSLAQVAAWCGSRGITALEIPEELLPSWDRAVFTDLRHAFAYAGVTPVCLAAETDFTLAPADPRFDQIEHVRHLLHDVAVPLGASLVRVVTGAADPGEAAGERVLEALRALVPDVQATGIGLAVEQSARLPLREDRLAAIIAGVGDPRVGSYPDIGTPADRRELALAALAPLATLVRARSRAFTPAGEESTIDYRRALAVLKAQGFNGDLIITYDGPGDPAQGVLATQALITHYWERPAGLAA